MGSPRENLYRLLLYYGSPKAAAEASGLPVKYFYPPRLHGPLRSTVSSLNAHRLNRAVAELDGVFEIKLPLESREKAERLAAAQGVTLRELVESAIEAFLR